MIDAFEYLLRSEDQIIGVVTESPKDYRIILRPNINEKENKQEETITDA